MQHHLSLHWRHNDHDGVSNHQPRGCLLNRLFGRRSNKTSKLRVTGLCAGNSPGPVNSPHKGPVTRKMFPFDDVIMSIPSNHGVFGSVVQWFEPGFEPLTHRARDKMAAITQTMFSNALSWMKIFEFRLKFHLSLSLMLQLTICHQWFR